MLLLSFIIPAYNCEHYIKSCLQSIAQCGLHYSQYEVIVVNDASTDHTLDVIQKCLSLIKYLRVIDCKESGGPATARCKGLCLAKGKYIWFVDADDLIEPQMGKILVPYMEQDYDLIGFNYQIVNQRQTILKESFSKEWKCTGVQYLTKMYHGIYLWDKVFRRTSLTKSFIKDVNHIEDFYFVLVNTLPLSSVLCLPICGYNYMQWNEGSISKRRDLSSILKANTDAYAIYSAIKKMRESKCLNKTSEKLIALVLSHGVAGHFYTMLQESPLAEIKKYIHLYHLIGLYPVPLTDEKKKNIFIYLVNHRFLFLAFTYCYHLLKR